MTQEPMSESAQRFWDAVGRLRTFGLTVVAYALGLFSGRWWVLPFPFVQLAIVEPLVNRARYPDELIIYSNDREAEIVAGTVGLLIGLALHWLLVRGFDALHRRPSRRDRRRAVR
jgi:hypothetical protein